MMLFSHSNVNAPLHFNKLLHVSLKLVRALELKDSEHLASIKDSVASCVHWLVCIASAGYEVQSLVATILRRA